jgi:hypothetical protein
MRISFRDVGIAASAMACGWGVAALAQQQQQGLLGPAV